MTSPTSTVPPQSTMISDLYQVPTSMWYRQEAIAGAFRDYAEFVVIQSAESPTTDMMKKVELHANAMLNSKRGGVILIGVEDAKDHKQGTALGIELKTENDRLDYARHISQVIEGFQPHVSSDFYEVHFVSVEGPRPANVSKRLWVVVIKVRPFVTRASTNVVLVRTQGNLVYMRSKGGQVFGPLSDADRQKREQALKDFLRDKMAPESWNGSKVFAQIAKVKLEERTKMAKKQERQVVTEQQNKPPVPTKVPPPTNSAAEKISPKRTAPSHKLARQQTYTINTEQNNNAPTNKIEDELEDEEIQAGDVAGDEGTEQQLDDAQLNEDLLDDDDEELDLKAIKKAKGTSTKQLRFQTYAKGKKDINEALQRATEKLPRIKEHKVTDATTPKEHLVPSKSSEAVTKVAKIAAINAKFANNDQEEKHKRKLKLAAKATQELEEKRRASEREMAAQMAKLRIGAVKQAAKLKAEGKVEPDKTDIPSTSARKIDSDVKTKTSSSASGSKTVVAKKPDVKKSSDQPKKASDDDHKKKAKKPSCFACLFPRGKKQKKSSKKRK